MGLWLNRDRAAYRRANETLIEINAALGGLSQEWFTALSDDDDLGAAEYARYAAHRALDALQTE